MASEQPLDISQKLKGLTSQQVLENREKYGENILTPAERDPWWKLLLEKFNDPIIRILMIAAVIAIAVGTINGEYFEGIGIVIAILLATVLAFLNEYKAGKEFEILNQVSDEIMVKVIRDGSYKNIPRKDVVKFDIVLLEPGEEVPADGIVLEEVSFQVDEAKLTGESLPVAKFPEKDSRAKGLVDHAYPFFKVLRSTLVSDGHATIEVTDVGDETEIGKASFAATEETHKPSPLNLQLEKLSQLIGVVGFSIAFLTFSALIFRDYSTGELILEGYQWGFSSIIFLSMAIGLSKVWIPIISDGFDLAGKKVNLPDIIERGDIAAWLYTVGAGVLFFVLCIVSGSITGYLPEDPSLWLTPDAISAFVRFFMIAVTIIVVAVPEGLPMSVTLSLAYSMRRMTAANNLVRRMHACETIGAANVICSDKTGTLTQNKMQLQSTFFQAFAHEKLAKSLSSDIEKIIAESIAANSTANISRVDGVSSPIGNPTEGAALMWLEESGIDYLPLRKSFKLERQWTFSTERKMMGSLGISSLGDERILYIKGAPEIILDRCSEIITAKGIESIKRFNEGIKEQLQESQRRGMRTLGFAFLRDVDLNLEKDLLEIANGLTWLGFIAIADPIRPDVPIALEACRNAGVKVKVITGDNSNTAWEIANQIGLIEEGDVPEKVHMTGVDFQALSPEAAAKAVETIKILSRARPADKMKMVKLLQKNGNVVAVTGDGTNDAPALNHANVGLAMGKTGTSVAKEASDIILLDDSFPSVVKGIMWGRSLYDNIKRFVMFQLTINVVALGVALTGPFIGVKMPLTVIQMLWVNLIMDTFAALALATEPPHWKVMTRKPRKPKDFIVTRPMYMHIFGVGAAFFVILVAMLKYFQKDGVVSLWELSVFFTTFVLLQFWNMFNARCLGLKQSALKGLSENKGFMIIAPAIVIIQFFIVTFGKKMFRTEALSLKTWLIMLVSTSFVLWIGEAYRYLTRETEDDPELDECPFD